MIRIEPWKIGLILIVCLMGILYAVPNMLGQEMRTRFQDAMPSWGPGKTVNLGLDLRGGAHLLMDVGIETVFEETFESLGDSLRDDLSDENIAIAGLRSDQTSLSFRVTNPTQGEEARRVIRQGQAGFLVDGDEEGNVTVSLTESERRNLINNTISQSIEIIRRRIDETGTREPVIQRQGDRRILVQLPGVEDPERVKALIGKTAKLSFHLEDREVTVTGRRRPGTQLLPMQDNPAQEIGIQRRAIITGDMLQNAQSSFDQNSQPVVSFRLNGVGAKRFCDVTTQNVNKPFAIVLDGEVVSAPNIREPICGGSGQISGGFTVSETSDLALVLRAGALPAPLDIVEERTIGPSLGADSVEAGKMASGVGLLFVIIFMVASYGLFGAFAVMALIINLCLIFALLSAMQATLTLPGIAGIVLTVGMAVDANVLIFERIREEFRQGRSLYASIDSGYARAISTIVDANITTLIAAVFLYAFGTGPIKGFAVTLSIGILTSMFSAVMVTRLMVVAWLNKTNPKGLPL